jgi:hypothetical protein
MNNTETHAKTSRSCKGAVPSPELNRQVGVKFLVQ